MSFIYSIRLIYSIIITNIRILNNLFSPYRELSSEYPEQILFKSILSGIPFQTQSLIQQQLPQNILLRLRECKGSGELINNVLNDLDKISESKPEILEYFVVKKLIF